jgi:hypothetical protein
MKYIMLRLTQGETVRDIPILFPEYLVHSQVASALKTLPGLELAEPVAAGSFSSLGLAPKCHGESETLNLSCRPEDSDNIHLHDYFYGMVD